MPASTPTPSAPVWANSPSGGAPCSWPNAAGPMWLGCSPTLCPADTTDVGVPDAGSPGTTPDPGVGAPVLLCAVNVDHGTSVFPGCGTNPPASVGVPVGTCGVGVCWVTCGVGVGVGVGTWWGTCCGVGIGVGVCWVTCGVGVGVGVGTWWGTLCGFGVGVGCGVGGSVTWVPPGGWVVVVPVPVVVSVCEGWSQWAAFPRSHE